MAKKARKARRPLVIVRGKKLKAAKGYKLKRIGRKSIALMRGGVKTSTFTCECNASGGCRVEMDGPSATCLENGCTGGCGWVVNVPGIYGGFRGVLAKR